MRSPLLLSLLAGCATAPSIQSPAPAPLIEHHPVRGTDRFRVVTAGLPTEVAVEGVEAGDLVFGRDVLGAALAALDGKPAVPGLELELVFGRARVPVKLISAAGGRLWVVDAPPAEATATPVRALATAAIARGLEAWEAAEPESARRLAIESVRLFPGDPLLVGPRSNVSVELNLQNHLAWALLAFGSDGVEQERFTIAALERSPALLAARLGAWPAELLDATDAQLFSTARSLVEANLGGFTQPRKAVPVVEVQSPIVQADGSRPSALLPVPFLGLYFEDPAASALREGPLVGLAVEAFERLKGDPVALLLATSEVRSIYIGADLFDPPPAEGAEEPWREMLSALLADVARKSAAGLTSLEIAATLQGNAEPESQALALVKMAEQRQRESAWYADALRAVER